MTPQRLHLMRPVVATATAATLFSLLATNPITAEGASAVPDKADARTVAHVLDRIGFGAKPGDVERVQKVGLTAYIEEQLHPEKIADESLNMQLEQYPTIAMSSKDLADKYFMPAMELRRDAQLKQQ